MTPGSFGISAIQRPSSSRSNSTTSEDSRVDDLMLFFMGPLYHKTCVIRTSAFHEFNIEMHLVLRYSVKYGALELSTTIHRGVGEGVGVGVFFAGDVSEGDRAESGGSLRKARLLFPQYWIAHFIETVHLLHD